MFSWSALLTEARACGLDFDTIPYAEWAQKLKHAAIDGDEARNPAIKLVDYFESTYDGNKGGMGVDIVYETGAAERDSEAMRKAPKVVEEGYARKFLESWLRRWR